MINLKNKNILITGASGGIGNEIVKKFISLEGNVLGNIRSADYQAWLIVLYLGLLMNVLGYSIWYYLLGIYPVNKILPIMLLLPVTGVVTAIMFLGERPDLKVFFGGIVILFGVGMILIGKIKNQRVKHI